MPEIWRITGIFGIGRAVIAYIIGLFMSEYGMAFL
jgi:hypothetical protein